MSRAVTSFWAIVPACLLAVTARSAEPPVKLFNGTSLDGWGFYLVNPNIKMTDVWCVKDGVLICKGEPAGYLMTVKDYTDFKLIVEWRWPEGKKPGNSGVLMRVTGEPKTLPKCVKAQLQHENAGDFWAFHGFKISGDPARTITKKDDRYGEVTGIQKIKDKGNEKKPGEWNTYEITAEGGTITLAVNGEVLNKATDCEVVAGKIALQSEGGEIHFRRVELTPIGKDTPPAPK
jgi:hypothetical protein